MLKAIRNEKGTALVATLFFITALSVTATVIVWVTSSERRVSHNEYTYTRAFYASDAGAETAINWIRIQDTPPPIIDYENQFVDSMDDYSTIKENPESTTDDHRYQYDIEYIKMVSRPGWASEAGGGYFDFEYEIDSRGASVNQSSTRIQVQASRLFKQGY